MRSLYIIFGSVLSFIIKAEAKYDPTMPVLTKAEIQVSNEPDILNSETASVAESLLLQGIVIKGEIRKAIISNQLYQIGDKVNGYILNNINDKDVLLTKSGSKKQLYVYE